VGSLTAAWNRCGSTGLGDADGSGGLQRIGGGFADRREVLSERRGCEGLRTGGGPG